MPEGDSAYRVAAQLDRALSGRILTQFQIRTGTLARADLSGETVQNAEAFGKHIIVRIGEYSLHSHMLMDGTWHLYLPGIRWRRPAHQARLVLGNDQVQAVGFLVGKIRLVRTDQESKLIGHLGPDPLKPEWNNGGLEKATRNLAADHRSIHVALLDQSNVAGFGNEYANEICFLAGIDPAAPAAQMDVRSCLVIGARLIRANLGRVERTTTGDTRPGKRLYVYGRAGQPCRRCGETIRFTRLGAAPSSMRHVYWCPSCQSLEMNRDLRQ